MSKHRQWLQQEVAQWRAEGLVDAELAQRILARYPAAAERGWGRMIFSAIGAVLIGLGVILFFAYNWQDIPKAAKLALVFAALAAAHAGAIALARRDGASPGLVEGLHALGTMMFGAGIWLVAQIYHIDEHYPNAFLIWALGALTLAWTLPSLVQALLALFLVSLWAGVEVFDFRDPVHGAPLLVALGVLPLAWWRRSPWLLFCTLAVLFLVSAFAVGWADYKALIPLLYLMAAAATIAGAAAPASAFPQAAGPLRSVGLLVVLGCAYALSFRDTVDVLGRVNFAKPGVVAYLGLAGGALVAALAGALQLRQRGGLDLSANGHTSQRWQAWQLALIGLGLAIVLAAMVTQARHGGWAIALPFNAIVLGLAALLILEGSEHLRPAQVGAGCTIFAVLTVSRYIDLFSSLLVRAAVFVALGAGLFLVGNFYARNRRRALEGQP
jgi:uncharacterized membrane protein